MSDDELHCPVCMENLEHLRDLYIEKVTKAGWRACIDHIIKPNQACPVCRLDRILEPGHDQLLAYAKALGGYSKDWEDLPEGVQDTFIGMCQNVLKAVRAVDARGFEKESAAD